MDETYKVTVYVRAAGDPSNILERVTEYFDGELDPDLEGDGTAVTVEPNDRGSELDARWLGERKRFRDAVVRLRHLLEALVDSVLEGVPSSSQRQAVTTAAVEVSNRAARIDVLATLREVSR